eukprot:402856-Amphidinium_carterae.2
MSGSYSSATPWTYPFGTFSCNNLLASAYILIHPINTSPLHHEKVRSRASERTAFLSALTRKSAIVPLESPPADLSGFSLHLVMPARGYCPGGTFLCRLPCRCV